MLRFKILDGINPTKQRPWDIGISDLKENVYCFWVVQNGWDVFGENDK